MRWLILLIFLLGCNTPKPVPEPEPEPDPIDYGIPLYQSESFREEFEQWDLESLHLFVDDEELSFVEQYKHFKKRYPYWSEDKLIKYSQVCNQIAEEVYQERVQ